MIEAIKKEKVVTPFKTQTLRTLSTSMPKEIPYLVEGLLVDVGISSLSAKPKTGKSSFARTLTAAVSTGSDFLGMPTQCGKVLYLNLEGPRGVLQQHFDKLGVSDSDKIFVVDERMPSKGELGIEMLEETIKAHLPLSLVVVDPVSKLLRLLDSFDPNKVGVAIENLEWLAKKYSLHLMFLSHDKKRDTPDSFDGQMGSTSFRGGTDTNINMKKIRGQRIIETEQKWGTAIEPTVLLQDPASLTLSLGTTVESADEAHSEAKSRKNKEKIRQEIRHELLLNTKLMQKDILSKVRHKNETVIRELEEMEDAHELTTEEISGAIWYSIVEIPLENAA